VNVDRHRSLSRSKDQEAQRQSCLITGAANGIGHAIAKRYLEADGRVVIADIDPAKAAQAARELADKKSAIGIRMDVSNEEEVNAGVDQAAATFGTVDVLVSNAGIQIVHPIEDSRLQSGRSYWHPSRWRVPDHESLRHMYKQNTGALIYMGSVHSHEASPLKSAYVAAKHGNLGLARMMAMEGAKHNVRANVICPGLVMTPLVQKQIPEQAKELGITEERVVKEVMLGETVVKSCEPPSRCTLTFIPSKLRGGQVCKTLPENGENAGPERQ
jgi:3-hydroxybutyrate dehydrogenase